MRTKLQSLLLSFLHKCVVQANINYIYTLEGQIPAILHHLCPSVVSIDSIILKYSKAHVADGMKSPIHFERKQLTDYIVCANFVEFSSTCLPMLCYSS